MRLVAATNRDLRREVAERRFREDLYFRLSVLPITVPPLRERGDDILLLARHFVTRHARTSGRPAPSLADDACTALLAYPWPGNVRELQNCLERAAILAESHVIQARHLRLLDAAVPPPPAPAAPADALDLRGTLDQVVDRARHEAERRKIGAALADAGNDPRLAAEALGVPFRELLARMRAHGLGTR
jgi:DNA-binding NtrC family response regulator